MTDQLTPEHIKSFLAKYENPADAREFLLKAGLIDELGNLASPYRSLSPAAGAIYEAYCTEADRLDREVSDREMLAAALRATADQLYLRWSELSHPADVLNNIADELDAQ